MAAVICSDLTDQEICKAMYFHCEPILETTKQSALWMSLEYRLLSIRFSLHFLVLRVTV